MTPLEILIMETGNGKVARRTLNALNEAGYYIYDGHKSKQREPCENGKIACEDLLERPIDCRRTSS